MIHPFHLKDLKQHTLCYWYEKSPFGRVLLASTEIGICYAAPSPDDSLALSTLLNKFKGTLVKQVEPNAFFQQNRLIDAANSSHNFHLVGTPFQLEVWKALLQIPFGETSTYGKIALEIGKPKAYRAVGSAVGQNPIFYLIPCHRVLPASQKVGNYLWGAQMKQELLSWESKTSINSI